MTATTIYQGIKAPPAKNAAAKSRDYVRRHWKYNEPGAGTGIGCCDTRNDSGAAASYTPFERLLSHSLCISGMAFQDAWNIDIERLQRCCVHVATTQNRLIPFCAYYMTDSQGRRLRDGGSR